MSVCIFKVMIAPITILYSFFIKNDPSWIGLMPPEPPSLLNFIKIVKAVAENQIIYVYLNCRQTLLACRVPIEEINKCYFLLFSSLILRFFSP